jgi:hypothetical protein
MRDYVGGSPHQSIGCIVKPLVSFRAQANGAAASLQLMKNCSSHDVYPKSSLHTQLESASPNKNTFSKAFRHVKH